MSKSFKIGINRFIGVTTIPQITIVPSNRGYNIIKPKYDLNKPKEMVYDGIINDFPGLDIGQTRSQYNKIQESFTNLNHPLEEIKGCCFVNYIGSLTKKFVAYSNDELISWYVQNTVSPGSGQNHVFINGHKIKTSTWLCLDSKGQKDMFTKCVTNQI